MILLGDFFDHLDGSNTGQATEITTESSFFYEIQIDSIYFLDEMECLKLFRFNSIVGWIQFHCGLNSIPRFRRLTSDSASLEHTYNLKIKAQ